MELSFWHDKWAKREIGFHLSEAHPWLVRYIDENPLTIDDVVFVPLCGKSLDIGFFLSLGLSVIGNELSEDAVKELFEELGLQPEVSPWGSDGKIYQGQNLKVYVGDFFKLTQSEIVNVSHVYDRAAIVALPEDMRRQYALKIVELCGGAKQILMTLEYDQNIMAGPPFSVTNPEVLKHYEDQFVVKEVVRRDIIEQEPRFKQKGLPEFIQCLYELNPK